MIYSVHTYAFRNIATDLATRDGDRSILIFVQTNKVNDLRERSELIFPSFTSGLFCDWDG